MRPGAHEEARRLVAEALGTAALLTAIVGSGIVVSGGGDLPAQLFQHAVVVGAALTALILAFGPVSGAHFNPAVTVADAWFGGMPWSRAGRYVLAQLVGAGAGTVFANVTFDLPAIALATTSRPGPTVAAAEAAAISGLLVVIFGLIRSGGGRVVAPAVGAYIAAAIIFTSSDAFANPAVTLARMFSDTWTGIAPTSVPMFLAGQVAGTVAAIALIGWMFHPVPREAAQVVQPTDHTSGTPAHHTSATPAHHTSGTPAHHTSGTPGEHASGTPFDPEIPMSETDLPTVLFLCVHNAGRSQMAAGWLEHLAGTRVRVLSGGSAPGQAIHPVAAEAMHEVGIDITDRTPRPWSRSDLERADVVVTMGCGDECPVIPGKRYLDWELTDPAGKPLDEVRPIRDEIRDRVQQLLAELEVEPVRRPG